MANGFELECPKCYKCGQQMQGIIRGDRGAMTAKCECKNPNCPSKEPIHVITEKKCTECGNENMEYFGEESVGKVSGRTGEFGKDKAWTVYRCQKCNKQFKMKKD